MVVCFCRQRTGRCQSLLRYLKLLHQLTMCAEELEQVLGVFFFLWTHSTAYWSWTYYTLMSLQQRCEPGCELPADGVWFSQMGYQGRIIYAISLIIPSLLQDMLVYAEKRMGKLGECSSLSNHCAGVTTIYKHILWSFKKSFIHNNLKRGSASSVDMNSIKSRWHVCKWDLCECVESSCLVTGKYQEGWDMHPQCIVLPCKKIGMDPISQPT